MQVIQINNIHHFDQMKTNWEQVYAADPHAHFFVSWPWLRGWFDITPFTWLVLAIRPDEASPYVAFFPLNIRFLRVYRFNLIRELRMGSKPLGGYTGFVCLPEYEKEAMATFACYLQDKIRWDSFQMEHVFDPRLGTLLQLFSPSEFNIQITDHIACTHIDLPTTWKQYLEDCVGKASRKNIRRYTRRIEHEQPFQIVNVNKDNLEKQIDAVQNVNQLRWGKNPKHILAWERLMFRHCFENDCLWLGILWDKGEISMSGRVAFLDRNKRVFYGYYTGYNPKYANWSPGKVLLGYTIKHAIESGFSTYDFLMGGDQHKIAFGAQQHGYATSLILSRTTLRSRIAYWGLDLARQIRATFKQMSYKFSKVWHNGLKK